MNVSWKNKNNEKDLEQELEQKLIDLSQEIMEVLWPYRSRANY
jgi:hypothetical protein